VRLIVTPSVGLKELSERLAWREYRRHVIVACPDPKVRLPDRAARV
jgi:hypothetical protein